MREQRDSKAYACSNSDLDEVLLYDVVFWDKIKKFRVRLNRLRWTFLRFGGAFNLFVPFLMPVNAKKSS